MLVPVFLAIVLLVLVFVFSQDDSPQSPAEEPPQAVEHDTQKSPESTRIRKSLNLPDQSSKSESLLQPIATPQIFATAEEPESWVSHTIKSGDTLSSIFSKLEIHSQLKPILADKTASDALRSIYPGQVIKVTKEEGQLQKLVYEPNDKESLYITRNANGYDISRLEHPVEKRTNRASAAIQDSLFLAGRKAGLSDNITMELAGIFGWDVDFALDIRTGDQFTVLYEELYREGDKIGDGAIIAAEFTNQGRTYRAIRYQRPDGEIDYYSPDGRSMRKAFLRTPVNFTRISSRFNLKRKHPVLNKVRAHKGVDYAAPKGTPVKSVGDGKVIFKGRKGGYGRVVIIQHGSKYSTLYAHLNSYNKKTKKGARVKQGQTIGYVGMSGLATGPHLHYEFRVNGVHRNPLAVKLPAAEPLPKKYMADFNAHSEILLSQLDLYRRTTIAEAAGDF
jgi:murein DD-endopeptidase MepM/ murein hydrolase activator NlpD